LHVLPFTASFLVIPSSHIEFVTSATDRLDGILQTVHFVYVPPMIPDSFRTVAFDDPQIA
jgi:hypothetical protein